MTSTETPMQVLVVVEDDPDVQFLIESIFSMDPRFNAADVAESAEEPAIDALLLKTDSTQLLPLAQRLTGLGVLPT